MQVEIKHLDVISVTKMCFVLYAVLGIVVGLIYVIVAVIFSGFMDYADAFEGSGFLRIAATGLGVLLVPVVALLYGCIGAIVGVVFAGVYNLVAGAVGGVRVTLTGREPGAGSVIEGKGMEVRL